MAFVSFGVDWSGDHEERQNCEDVIDELHLAVIEFW